MLMFLTVTVFQSCQDDITDFADPRDAIEKSWRTNDSGNPNADYDVIITKDTDETTKVWLENFHALGFGEKISATMAGDKLTISNQVMAQDYTISGTGIISSDLKNIDWDYSVTTTDGTDYFTAQSGEQVVVAAKKRALASL